MKFREDRIQNFIAYKLANNHESQLQLKLYNLQLQYDNKLSGYLQQLHKTRHLYSYYLNQFQQTSVTRQRMDMILKEEGVKLDEDSIIMKNQIQSLTKRKKERIQLERNGQKMFEETAKELRKIKAENDKSHSIAIKQNTQQIQFLIQQNELNLKSIEQLSKKLSEVKQKHRILSIAESNLQNTRSAHNEINLELEQSKIKFQAYEKEQKLIQQRNASFEKVIYGRMTDRIAKSINEIEQNLEDIGNGSRQFNLEGNAGQQILMVLNSKKDHVKRMLEERKAKLNISSEVVLTEEIRSIVEKRVNPSLLSKVQIQTLSQPSFPNIKDAFESLNTKMNFLLQDEKKLINQQKQTENTIKERQNKLISINNEIDTLRKNRK